MTRNKTNKKAPASVSANGLSYANEFVQNESQVLDGQKYGTLLFNSLLKMPKLLVVLGVSCLTALIIAYTFCIKERTEICSYVFGTALVILIIILVCAIFIRYAYLVPERLLYGFAVGGIRAERPPPLNLRSNIVPAIAKGKRMGFYVFGIVGIIFVLVLCIAIPVLSAKILKSVKQQAAIANAQKFITDLSEKCTQKCITSFGSSLSSSEKQCLQRCISIFISSWDLVSQSVQKRLQEEVGHSGGGFGGLSFS